MIRRKRRIRIALWDLWDGAKDLFTPHHIGRNDPRGPEIDRRWAEYYRKVKLAAQRSAGHGRPSQPSQSQPSAGVPPPNPGGPGGYLIARKNEV
jgi:hypothetical protein